MITPSQIREKKLSTVESGGYDRDEVNELLLDVIESYEAIFDENKELYRKMEVLANRIEEYRADEDSIKTALITAQKMASKVTKDAKEKADKSLADSAASAQQTVVDAKEKADKIIGEARKYVADLTKEKEQAAEEIIAQAEKKANEAIESAKVVAANALSQAKKLAEEIVSKAKAERAYQSEIMAKLKEDSQTFRKTLEELYKEQLDKLDSMPVNDASQHNADEEASKLEKELDIMIKNITEIVGEDEAEEEAQPEEAVKNEPQQEPAQEDEDAADDIEEAEDADTDTAEDETDDEPEENSQDETEDVEEIEESGSVSQEKIFDFGADQVDEIIDEIESMDKYSPLHEPEEIPASPEEVSNAIDAFTTDEITPIDENAKSIPVIEDEPEFESSMPFENYFHIKKGNERTNETISLISPEEEEEDDSPKFKGFFKKKK